MSTTFSKIKPDTTSDISSNELQRLFRLSLEIADIAEDILESRGAYSKEFLSGLKKSLKDAREGKVKKIKSLSELR